MPSRFPSVGFSTSFNFLPVCLVLLPAEAAPWEGEEIECLFLESAKRVQPKANTITSGCAQASEKLRRNNFQMGNALKPSATKARGDESITEPLRSTFHPSGGAPAHGTGWNEGVLRVPSNPDRSVIPWILRARRSSPDTPSQPCPGTGEPSGCCCSWQSPSALPACPHPRGCFSARRGLPDAIPGPVLGHSLPEASAGLFVEPSWLGRAGVAGRLLG